MSLLKTVILSDVVEVISSDDDSPLHFHFDDSSSQDTTSNGDIACEWALLVNVFSLNGLTWDLETETDISGISELLSWDLLLEV